VSCWFPARCWKFVWIAALAVSSLAHAEDKTIQLKLPKRTKPTPVQQLNRDGVNAIQRHEYDKAKKLFYKAYLLDPNDPFTLNNLGYMSELEGDGERAQRYYDLAQQQPSEAAVDLASTKSVEGKPVSKVAGNAAEAGMQVNQMNMAAISLLRKGRAPEADLMLQQALTISPQNPFTLNNLGYTKEKEGEFEAALGYYSAAVNTRSNEPVIVSVNRDWRGRAISEVADENARKVRKLMVKEQTSGAKVARLNLEGVSAMNRNDRRTARDYFDQAYKLDPADAFTLNNMGFLAELDGDRETANFYYEKAAEAKRHKETVTVATRPEAEGKKVESIAQNSNQKVDQGMKADLETKRRQGGEVVLKRRDGTTVTAPEVQQQQEPKQEKAPDAK
jgi:Flp pilus assembly protein TadD